MSSEYFTTTPEMKALVEVVAAAIEGNYVSFHVLVHGSVVPVEVKQPVFQSQEKGTRANFTCAKENEENLPYAQQTDKIMPKTEMETSLSSTLHPHSYQVPSKTMDTSMNSSQASEYEEAKSEEEEKKAGLKAFSPAQHNCYLLFLDSCVPNISNLSESELKVVPILKLSYALQLLEKLDKGAFISSSSVIMRNDDNLVRAIRSKPTLPTNFEEDTWAKLKSAICAIFLKQPNSCDLEKLYQAVNDLCLYKMGVNLHQQIEKECEAHISAALQSLVGQSPDLVVFLSLVERCWQDLCDQMLMIRGIALYLDRTYVKQTANVRSLWDMGLQLFRKHLSLSPEVEHKTVTGLLRMIESER
ncbi:hypothetical protein JHK82_043723 [Glycine max]|nr:hypothetical protein JHK85_044269 [Glycine max]KAG5106753.1 hypothetical protein JHK82_043723 [Glycine max]